MAKTYRGEIAGRLQTYQELARKEAQQQRPPTDSNGLDQNEAQIKSEAEAALAEQRELLNAELNRLSTAATDLRQKVVKARGECEQELLDDMMKESVQTALSERRDDLANVVKQRMFAETDLKTFKANHDIREQASYPDSRLNHLGWIVALSALETAVNAVFYENSQGLLGGFLVALGISAFTIASSVLLGYLGRHKNLVPAEERIKGYGSIGLFFLLLLFANALFAHFRSNYQLIDSTDSIAVRGAFKAAVGEATKVFYGAIPLTDLSSFILFGIGILLMSLAFWKGYHLDDKYPGHGERDRKYKQRNEEEREAINRVRIMIAETIKGKKQRIQSLLVEPLHLATFISARRAELETADNQFSASVDSVKRDLEMVVTSYRQANTAIRATHPPAYFSETPLLQVIDPAPMVRRLRDTFDIVAAETHSLKNEFQQPLQERQQKLSDEGNSLMNEGLKAFGDSIILEAEGKINQGIQVVSRQR